MPSNKTAGGKPAAKKKSRPPAAGHTPAGLKIIAGLKAAISELETGSPKLTARLVRRDPFPTDPVTAADAAAIRASVGASQPVFASLVGVSTATVRAWEGGAKPVSGTAQKLLDLIRRDPKPWADRVREAAAPPANGPA